MNFNILINFVSCLSFTIDFNVSDEYYQDFFLFNGNNSNAHLFRKNTTLILYLNHMNDYNLYKFYNVTKNFSFQWPKFTINNTDMHQYKSNINGNTWNFTNFTFISPKLGLCDIYSSELSHPHLPISNFKYTYFIIIMIIAVIVLKSDIKTFKYLLNSIRITAEIDSDYVSMKSQEFVKPDPTQDHNERH